MGNITKIDRETKKWLGIIESDVCVPIISTTTTKKIYFLTFLSELKISKLHGHYRENISPIRPYSAYIPHIFRIYIPHIDTELNGNTEGLNCTLSEKGRPTLFDSIVKRSPTSTLKTNVTPSEILISYQRKSHQKKKKNMCTCIQKKNSQPIWP